MQTRYKIWTVIAASVAGIAAVVFFETRNQTAVASSEITATVQKDAPAVQHRPIVPAGVLDPIDLQWGPRTGDHSN
jgi:hypothetical protein